VAADADVAYAAEGAVWGAFSQAGQVCSAVERVYVARPMAAAFVDRVLEATAVLAARAGFREQDGVLLSPAASETYGPLISAAARERVHGRVMEAAARGARVRAGGRIPEGPGFWYPPTVLTDTSDEMAIMQEETFGPVLPIAVVADEEEAVARANASRFGLTASVWTKDLARGRRLAARLQVGLAMVNDHSSAYGMIDSPWGGRKASGTGRLHGPEALLELTEPAALVTDRVPTPKVWWYPYTPEALAYFRWGNEVLFAGSLRRRLAALGPTVRALLAGRRRPGLAR
jgi:succinate-semialdehyde dehydrogenase/glutarate-semialdehyde dehydrogenase